MTLPAQLEDGLRLHGECASGVRADCVGTQTRRARTDGVRDLRLTGQYPVCREATRRLALPRAAIDVEAFVS